MGLDEMDANVDLASRGLEDETRRAMRLKEEKSVWRLHMIIVGLSILLFLLYHQEELHGNYPSHCPPLHSLTLQSSPQPWHLLQHRCSCKEGLPRNPGDETRTGRPG